MLTASDLCLRPLILADILLAVAWSWLAIACFVCRRLVLACRRLVLAPRSSRRNGRCNRPAGHHASCPRLPGWTFCAPRVPESINRASRNVPHPCKQAHLLYSCKRICFAHPSATPCSPVRYFPTNATSSRAGRTDMTERQSASGPESLYLLDQRAGSSWRNSIYCYLLLPPDEPSAPPAQSVGASVTGSGALWIAFRRVWASC